MPVRYYKSGENPSGFVGHRVYRSMGDGSESQKYFSNAMYGYATGKRLAYQLDREWEQESVQIKKEHRLTQVHTRGGEGVIVAGLRADISKRGKSLYVGFFVIKPKTTESIYFGTKRAGYVAAWRNAVDAYARLYGYDESAMSELRSNLPEKTIFTGYLLDRHRKKGHTLSTAELMGFIET